VFSSSRRAILSSIAFETNGGSYFKHCLSLSAASSVGERVNPNKDGGAFGDGGGGDHNLDPNSSGSDEGRKKFVSRSSLFGGGRSGSGLFRFSSANINLASNSSIADAIFYSEYRLCKEKQDCTVAFLKDLLLMLFAFTLLGTRIS
jgi:hypothetical protein